MPMVNLVGPIILALSPLNIGGMGRRAALAAFASTAALTASPAQAFTDPLSRLADNTKSRRLREAAERALQEAEQQQPQREEQQQQPAEGTTSAGTASVGTASVAEEAVLSTSAGLAKIDAELNEAYELAEDASVAQLRRLLRSPVFTSFLGFAPGTPDMERQVELLLTFPSKSRIEAAETLRDLNIKLRALDESLAGSAGDSSSSEAASSSALTAAVSEAKALSQQFTKLYLVDGCLVCPDQIKGYAQSDFENPNLRKLKEFEPRLLRRPDERDEALARRLGFREGELIGGYE